MIEVILIFVLYYVCIYRDLYEPTIYVISAAAVTNFAAMLIAWVLVSNKVKEGDYSMSSLRPEKGRDLGFYLVISDSKFLGLFFSTLIIVGA